MFIKNLLTLTLAALSAQALPARTGQIIAPLKTNALKTAHSARRDDIKYTMGGPVLTNDVNL
jgi:hypothetical protein